MKTTVTNLKTQTALLAGMEKDYAEKYGETCEVAIFTGSSKEEAEQKYYSWRLTFKYDVKSWTHSEWVVSGEVEQVCLYAALDSLTAYEVRVGKPKKRRKRA